jgi:predicted nuclease of predicted toxin-antitoxin system
MPDAEVYKIACEKKLIIITMDKDFTRIFRFPPEKCGGIIVVKIYKCMVDDTLAILKEMFKSLNERNIKQNLVIISPEGIRIKKSKNR